MPEDDAQNPENITEPGAADSASGRVLLFVIVPNPGALDDLITALLDIGLTGATVIDSQGMGAILRRDMPIFAGLASLIPDRTGNKMLLSLTTPELAELVFRYVAEETQPADRPIAFTVEVAGCAGLP